MNDRHREILKHLSVDHETSVKHLTEVLGVSSVTIRQDLIYWSRKVLLKRVHGGAVLKDADDIANRLGLNYDKKLKIARRAAKFVDHGETVLIESGSVNALLARELVKKGRINILTTNIFIARQFRKIHEAILCCSEVSTNIKAKAWLARSQNFALTILIFPRHSSELMDIRTMLALLPEIFSEQKSLPTSYKKATRFLFLVIQANSGRKPSQIFVSPKM
jgi:hypothetical protein